MAQTQTSKRPGLTRRFFARLENHSTRSGMLSFAAAAIGLALAIANVLAPANPPAAVVPPGYVALVNQRPILMDDFIKQTEATVNMPFDEATATQKQDVLQAMIDEELFVQRALVLDLPEQDTDVREALVNSTINALVVEQTPTDEELMSFFNAHRASYATEGTMRFKDIVMHVGGFENANQTVDQALADAHEAVYQLRAGAPLDYVMQHFGFVNSGRSDGGDDFNFAAKLHLGDKLFAVASQLSDGEVSEPTVDTDGVHVIIMDQRVLPQFADFEHSRDRVYSDYQIAAHKRAEQNNLKFLRSEAQIVVAPGYKVDTDAPVTIEPKAESKAEAKTAVGGKSGADEGYGQSQ